MVNRFDKDGNTRLDYDERSAAREYLVAHPELRQPVRRGPTSTHEGTPGPALSPEDVAIFPDNVPLYDADTLRTLLLQFEHEDWEEDLAAFWHTDVEVHATVILDGKTYRDVGVNFRGNNSFTAVPAGLKRSLTLRFDSVHEDQDALGYRTLHLLNSNQDPMLLRSVLYLDIAREYIPALEANFMRVVINGRRWGVYPNQQSFSSDFLRDIGTTGKRWTTWRRGPLSFT